MLCVTKLLMQGVLLFELFTHRFEATSVFDGETCKRDQQHRLKNAMNFRRPHICRGSHSDVTVATTSCCSSIMDTLCPSSLCSVTFPPSMLLSSGLICHCNAVSFSAASAPVQVFGDIFLLLNGEGEVFLCRFEQPSLVHRHSRTGE